MRKLLSLFAILIPVLVFADGNQPPPMATQTEVNAGAIDYKYVSPKTLAGFLGGTNETVITTNNFMLPIAYFGALGGTNDDTVAFQSALNSGVAVFVDPRTNYTVGKLFPTNNSTLIGYSSVIRFVTNGNVSGFMFNISTVCSNVNIHGLYLDGQKWSFTANGGANPWFLTANTNVSTGFNISRCAFQVSANGTNVDISGNYVKNFSDTAFRFIGGLGSFPQPIDSATRADNNMVFNCFTGFEWTNNAEYMVSHGLQADNCGYGTIIGSGNNYIDNSRFVRNGCGVRVLGQIDANPAHGEVSDSTINHNDIAILATGFNNGFLFDGCIILGGGGDGTAVSLFTNCSGVFIMGGYLSSNHSFVGYGGGTNVIMNNMCQGAPAIYMSGTSVILTNNYNFSAANRRMDSSFDITAPSINSLNYQGNGNNLTNVATGYWTNVLNGVTNISTTTQVQSWKIPAFAAEPAGVLGNAEIDAQVQRADGVWVTLDKVDIAGGVTSIIQTNKTDLVFDVYSGQSWRLTNSTSGSGYVAGLDSTSTNQVLFH